MSIYQFDFCYSDPHYGHTNIIKYCDRPFSDVDHMKWEMIARYNAMVRTDQTVLWFGDCAMGGIDLSKVLDKLNGKKLLIRGNHDKSTERMLGAGFESVYDGPLYHTIGGFDFVLSHYPPKTYQDPHDSRYQDRKPMLKDKEICIHGHTHETIQVDVARRRIHVGVDAWNYAPVPMEEVLKLASTIEYDTDSQNIQLGDE